jgi:hypothetical protein
MSREMLDEQRTVLNDELRRAIAFNLLRWHGRAR